MPQRICEDIAAVMDRIYRAGMTTASGGNISVRDDAGTIWITPARLDKGRMTSREIVGVQPDGSVIAPSDRGIVPSSEFPFHQAIYAERPDINAVVHAHPTGLVTFSICHEVPDAAILPATAAACGRVGYAPYERTGSAKLGACIAGVFAGGNDAAILQNHGVVTGGVDLAAAYDRFEMLERTARIIGRGRLVGDVNALDAGQLTQAGATASPIEATRESSIAEHDDADARAEICHFAQRGVARDLMTSRRGSISRRIGTGRNAAAFVITASRFDRAAGRPKDLAFVDGDTYTGESPPDASAAFHRAVYDAHPDVNVVVTGHPVHAMGFAVTDAVLEPRAIPESYMVLRRIVDIPFDAVYPDPTAAAAMVSLEKPVALARNAGAVTLGRTTLEAFDRLEVLEGTAEALIDGARLGDVHLLDDATLRELDEYFHSDRRPRD